MPKYSFDIQTKTLTIGLCPEEEEVCEITQKDYQNSGPYKTYKIINIEQGATTIQSEAFFDSPALEEVHLSSWISNIYLPFCRACSSLKVLSLTSPSQYYEIDLYGNLYSKKSKSLIRSPTTKTYVEILESTEIICGHSFSSSNIQSLTIPKNVKSIESRSMYNSRIQILNFAQDSKISLISSEALSILPSLETIEFPQSLQSIGEDAMAECSNLKKVIFPADSDLKSIGTGAFQDDKSLVSITLPDGVTSISANAFASCSSLSTISLSRSLQSLDPTAFSGCGAITEIHISEDNEKYTVIEGSLYSKALDSVIIIPTGIKSFTIPNELTSIGQTALQLCPNLSLLNINENHPTFMKHEKMLIDKSTKTVLAFVGGIEDVNIPDGITSLGPYCGYKCKKLKNVEIRSSVNTLGEYCFSQSSITSISLPGVTQYGLYVFELCKSLVDIYFIDSEGSSIRFDEGTFIDCSSISTLHFKCKVLNVPYRFCRYCGAKKVIFEKDGFNVIEQGSFEYMSRLESITFPKSLEYISMYSFQSSSMKELIFPNGCSVKRVGSLSFSGCSKLQSIEFLSSLERIDSSAFVNCYSLKRVKIGDECPISELLAGDMFKNCRSIETFNMPANVQKIEPSIFTGCSNLRSFTATGSSIFTSKNGILYDIRNNQKILIICPPGLPDAEIDEEVTGLGVRCFYQCTLLNTVDFPKSTKLGEIGDSVFFGCSGLKDLKIPQGVWNISGTAFTGCTGLSKIELDYGSIISYLGDGIFSGLTNLSSINLEVCTKLERIPADCFKGCESLLKLHLPYSITSIGAFGFSGCKKMTSILLPESIEMIGESCFSGSGLRDTLILPKNISFVGLNALTECSLKHIVYCGRQKLDDDALGGSFALVHVVSDYPGIRCLGGVPIRDVSPECYIVTARPMQVCGLAVQMLQNIVSGGVETPSEDE